MNHTNLDQHNSGHTVVIMSDAPNQAAAAPVTSQTGSPITPVFFTPTTSTFASPAATITKPSIYRLPECFRQHKPEEYTPVVVSFGPFHHDSSDHLRPMEAHKRRVLEHILSLPETGSNIHEKELVTSMRQQLPELIGYFAGFEGILRGEEEYVGILIRRHSIDETGRCVVGGGLPETNCDREKLGRWVTEAVKEFVHLLVKHANEDEFIRFTIRGDEVSRIMLRYGVENLVDVIVRCPHQQSADRSDNEEFTGANDMACKCMIEFTRRLVKDGLDYFARLMVTDGVFLIALMVVAARRTADDYYRKAIDAKVAAVAASGDAKAQVRARKKVIKADIAAAAPFLRLAESFEFSKNDPVFGITAAKEIWDFIQRDMMLIENQLPLLVLKILVDLLFPSHQLQAGDILRHVLQFLMYPILNQTSIKYPEMAIREHILGFNRNHMIKGGPRERFTFENAKTYFFNEVDIKSSEIRFDGFKFEKRKLYFWRLLNRGTLYIPGINISDTDASMILNMMAYERLHDGVDFVVTNFVGFMARLVGKPLHVKILRARYNIRLSNVWTKEEVAQFYQMAARNPHVATKSPNVRGFKSRFRRNPLSWPITCYRYVQLLLIEDRGRRFAYMALIFAFLSWLCTIVITTKYKK